MNICKEIKKFVSGFYAKDIYINFIEYLSQHPDEESLMQRPNKDYLSYSLIKLELQRDFNYTDNMLDEAKRFLINSGYILVRENPPKIILTEEGKRFWQDYYRFQLLGCFAKLTVIFNKNFIPIVSILALGISLFNLLFHSK